MSASRGLLLSILLFAVRLGTAQAEWVTYTPADGLTHNEVWAIMEDRAGNVWFGTGSDPWFFPDEGFAGGGASRYDGANWSSCLVDKRVRSILEDSDGNLWFGTEVGTACVGGVSRYDGVNWETYLTGQTVYSLLQDRDGNVWVGTQSGGVSCFDGTSWRTYTTSDGLADNWVLAILQDADGSLWFGTNGGVCRYDGVSWNTYPALGACWSILQDRVGDLWFGGNATVARYDGTDWQTYTTSDGVPAGEFRGIAEDHPGNLWFATSGGAVRYNRVSWRTYTTTDGLVDNEVRAVLKDSAGNLWFGTKNGVSRYDGMSWRTHTTADGLATNTVLSSCRDRLGNLWFGTDNGASRYDGSGWSGYLDGAITAIAADRFYRLWFAAAGFGVWCYDGDSWRYYTTDDGLGSSLINVIFEDAVGRLWFGGNGGVSRYDGTRFTMLDSLATQSVRVILQDRAGDFWFGTEQSGVWRYDGANWRIYTVADGLGSDYVMAGAIDRDGNLWFGTLGGGVSCYDGTSWRRYRTSDGLAGNYVEAALLDGSGNLWFGTSGNGVCRFDGTDWLTLTVADGLADNSVLTLLEDAAGSFWFGTGGLGVTQLEPDRVPPQTVITQGALRVSTSTAQTIGYAAAFRETGLDGFSYALDGTAWSEWSRTNQWSGTHLPDGEHVFMVKARDRFGNVDSTAAICRFEIDATPPSPVISSPAYSQIVRDSVVVRGTAADARFSKYSVQARPAYQSSWDLLRESFSPVTGGALCGWGTSLLADGEYELRLSVADTLGLVGTYSVKVTVDNQEPWAYETAPALVRTAAGGDVYTTDGAAHLYFPPHAFQQDATVTIAAQSDDAVPPALPDGAQRVFAGYEIGWGDVELLKPGTLEFTCHAAGLEPPVSSAAFYAQGADSAWRRVGGTADEVSGKISLPVLTAGQYALFSGGEDVVGTKPLAIVSLTPRVFSPTGSFADNRLAISLELWRPASVDVKVYNRAGRLVRDVVSGQAMAAGANLVYWDGRDGNGAVVPEGMYLVTVETAADTEAKTVSVVR